MAVEITHFDVLAVQAFIDDTNPDYGFVRFEAAGKVHQLRLPRRVFDQLARDIQTEAMRIKLQDHDQSQASNQAKSGKDS